MRALLTLLALLLAAPAFAQPAQGPYGPGPCPFSASSCTVTATGGTTARTLAAKGADVTNAKDFGATGNGSTDDTAAIQAAVTYACTQGAHPNVVFLPAGQYKITATITTTCNRLTISGGSGLSSFIVPVGNIDAFLCAKSPVSQNIFGCGYNNLQITTAGAVPTAGAAIHLNQASQADIHDLNIAGTFYGIEFSSVIQTNVNNILINGSNATAGSATVAFDSSTAAQNNANIHLTNFETRAPVANAYSYGALISNADGVTFTNWYFGLASVAGIYFHPVQTTDAIDNVYFINGVIDESNYGVLCDTEPGGYAANFGQIQFTGGSQLHQNTIDGFNNACPDMHDVNFDGTNFFFNGHSGVNLSAGSFFTFNSTIFGTNNSANTGTPHVALSGTVAHVQMNNGIMRNILHGPQSNLTISGGANAITATNMDYTGAGTADIAFSASTGTQFALGPYLTDRATSVGTCTGLGTGTCTLTAGSGPFSGAVQLSPTGVPAANGAFTVTFPSAAKNRYACSWTAGASPTWTAPVTFTEVIGSTSTLVVSWVNGAALTAGQVYLVDYQCKVL